MDYLNHLIEYEQGTLAPKETLELFSYLIGSGLAFTLQGHYGRTAIALIEDRVIDIDGTILVEV